MTKIFYLVFSTLFCLYHERDSISMTNSWDSEIARSVSSFRSERVTAKRTDVLGMRLMANLYLLRQASTGHYWWHVTRLICSIVSRVHVIHSSASFFTLFLLAGKFTFGQRWLREVGTWVYCFFCFVLFCFFICLLLVFWDLFLLRPWNLTRKSLRYSRLQFDCFVLATWFFFSFFEVFPG